MPTEAPSAGLVPSSRHWILTAIYLGAFMVSLDTAIVVCALPEISHQLHCSLAQISWVLVIYLLSQVSLLVTVGRLGDLWVPGRLYLLGLVLFSLASLLCQKLGHSESLPSASNNETFLANFSLSRVDLAGPTAPRLRRVYKTVSNWRDGI